MKIPSPAPCLVLLGAALLLSSCAKDLSGAGFGPGGGAPPSIMPDRGDRDGAHVRIRFDVDSDGNMTNGQVISSTDPSANEAALEGLKNTKFPRQPGPKMSATVTIVVPKGTVHPAAKKGAASR